jgi:nitrous oxide reductase
MIQQKQFEKKEIYYRVISPNGDDEYTFDHSTALQNIRALVKDDSKWLYINNDFKNPETLTTRDLDQAEDIILTNALAGGN